MTGGIVKIRARATGDESWKADAACRRVVRDYVRRGWSFERAQNYVTGLYYAAFDDVKPGRPGAGGQRAEDDPFFLPRLWCSTCPVAAQCLDEAVASGDGGGFRAGHTPKQLQRVFKIRRRERQHEEMGAQRLIISSGRDR